MIALERTIAVPADRRVRLDLDLPENVNTEWIEVGIFIQPLLSELPRKRKHTAREAIELLRGCCKDSPGTVDEFLAGCHADKERELAIEKRQAEEGARYAGLSS
jgi:hypothetical protein